MIRSFDIVLSLFSLILLSPLGFVACIAIIIDSRGSCFYIQKRIGLYGVEFNLVKFRTMYLNSEKSSLLSYGANDKRKTRIGTILRKYKIDELPQLINVLTGDMSLVGPRPEVKKYIDLNNPVQQKILQVRPGLSDRSSIKYRNEEMILSGQPNPEDYYIQTILPDKLTTSLDYASNPTLSEYFKIIFATLSCIFR